MPEWITGALSILLVYFVQDAHQSRKKIKSYQEENDEEQNKKLDEIEGVLLAQNKQNIYDLYTKYYLDLGYMPGYLKETLHTMYKFYHSHGGNGTGTKMYEDMMTLPHEPLKKAKK